MLGAAPAANPTAKLRAAAELPFGDAPFAQPRALFVVPGPRGERACGAVLAGWDRVLQLRYRLDMLTGNIDRNKGAGALYRLRRNMKAPKSAGMLE